MHGARYVVHHDGGDQVTTTYTVSQIRNVTCAAIRPLVSRLTHEPAKAHGAVRAPRGWYCASFVGGRASAGACAGIPNRYFSWQPKLPPPPPNAYVYTYDLEVIGSGSVTFSPSSGGGTVSSHWTLSVPGFRVRAVRRTSWLPAKYGKAGWELFFINGKSSGTATTTADYSNPPDGCAAHASSQLTARAEAGNDGVGTSGISFFAVGDPGCAQGPIDAFGGPKDSKGLCTGLAGMCWEFTPISGNFRFPNNHKRPRPWLAPMGQIVHGLSWSRTVHFDHTDSGGTTTVSVRVSLTRQQG